MRDQQALPGEHQLLLQYVSCNLGQFPTDGGGGSCQSLTRQGVTRDSAEIEVGVVTTDVHGDGTLTVVIGPVPAGTYEL